MKGLVMRCFMHRHMRRLLPLLACVGVLAGANAHEGHGDHDPKFNGFVMMYIDLHFEVVLGERGGVRVYYSDEMRDELPAAVVSAVHVDILPAKGEASSVAMSVSEGGDFWEGSGEAVTDRDTIVRVSFVFQDEPLVFELPAYIFPAFAAPAADHSEHSA